MFAKVVELQERKTTDSYVNVINHIFTRGFGDRLVILKDDDLSLYCQELNGDLLAYEFGIIWHEHTNTWGVHS